MEKNLNDEIKELMHGILAGHIAKIESKFDIIEFKLDNIQKQTERTNGRTNNLEAEVVQLKIKDANHVTTCPHKPAIDKLKEDSISAKAIKTFMLAAIGITATIVGVISTIIKLL